MPMTQGFSQGFGLVSNHLQGERRNRERQEALQLQKENQEYQRQRQSTMDEMRQEQHGLQLAQHDASLEQQAWNRERQEKQDGLRMEQHGWKQGEHAFKQQERQNKQRLRDLNALNVATQSLDGNIDPNDYRNVFADNPAFQAWEESTGTDPRKFIDEDMRPHVETAIHGFGEALMAIESGQATPVDALNSDDALRGFNAILGEQIKTRMGEIAMVGQNPGKIINKTITGVYPDEEGRGMMFNLTVETEGPDGEIQTYEAPVTAGHSASDEFVADIPLEAIMDRFEGHAEMLQATEGMSPDQFQTMLNSEIVRLGGELPEVDDGDRFGDITNVQGVGWGQYNESTGEFRQLDPSESGGSGGSGSGGSDELSSVDEKRFFDRAIGEVDKTLRFHLGEELLGDPDAAQLRTIVANASSRIVRDGRVLGQAGASMSPEIVGNTAVQMALSGRYEGLRPSDATALARKELSSGDGWLSRGPGDAEVRRRAQEIQRAQTQRFDQDLQRFVMSSAPAQGGMQMSVQRPAGGQNEPQSAGAGLSPFAQPNPPQSPDQTGHTQQAMQQAHQTLGNPGAQGGGLSLLSPSMRAPQGAAGNQAPSEQQRASAIEGLRSVPDETSAGTQWGRDMRERLSNDHLVQFVTRGIEFGNQNAVETIGGAVPAIPGKENVAGAIGQTKDAVAALFGSEAASAQGQLKPFTTALEDGREPSKVDVERAARWIMQNPDAVKNNDALSVVQFWLEKYENEDRR